MDCTHSLAKKAVGSWGKSVLDIPSHFLWEKQLEKEMKRQLYDIFK